MKKTGQVLRITKFERFVKIDNFEKIWKNLWLEIESIGSRSRTEFTFSLVLLCFSQSGREDPFFEQCKPFLGKMDSFWHHFTIFWLDFTDLNNLWRYCQLKNLTKIILLIWLLEKVLGLGIESKKSIKSIFRKK